MNFVELFGIFPLNLYGQAKLSMVLLCDKYPYLFLVDSFGHGPGRYDVVHYSFGQSPWHLMEFHKLPDTEMNNNQIIPEFSQQGYHHPQTYRKSVKTSPVQDVVVFGCS